MIRIFFCLSFICLAFLNLGSAQSCPFCSTLEIHVSGLRNSNGIVRIMLTNDKNNFEELDPKKINVSRAFFRNLKAKKEGVTFVYKDILKGTYAFKIFHDENSNEILDRSLLGKPLEGIAVSGYTNLNSEAFLFEKAKFQVPAAKKISKDVSLHYW